MRLLKKKAETRRLKKIEYNFNNKSKDELRCPVICVLGHVDTGLRRPAPFLLPVTFSPHVRVWSTDRCATEADWGRLCCPVEHHRQ